MVREIDNLVEDAPISGQKYVCLSFVSPEGIEGCNIRTLKIRGVYAKYEQAQERAKYLQETDSDFNVFIGEVGKWLPWDPNPEDAKDQVYYEKEMQELVTGYKENLAKAKKEVQHRASESQKGNAKQDTQVPQGSSTDRKQKQLEKMREKLKKINEVKEQAKDESVFTEHIKGQLDDDVSRYNEYIKTDSIEDKINTIKKLQQE